MAFRDLRMFSSFFYIIKRSDAWLFDVCGQRRIQDISIRGPDFIIRKKNDLNNGYIMTRTKLEIFC